MLKKIFLEKGFKGLLKGICKVSFVLYNLIIKNIYVHLMKEI